MKYIDFHCDTLMKAFFTKKEDLCETSFMLDLGRLKSGGAFAQFFAIFMPSPGIEEYFPLAGKTEDDAYIEGCIDIFNATLRCGEGLIAPAYSAAGISANGQSGRISGLLTLEDGRAVNGDFGKLKRYYDRGIRLISLTWNHANCFGFPNSADPELMRKGLTGFGRQAVERMNDLGMMVDVSHLSDGGFADAAEISKKPFVASHSNCRAISPHQRNLSDEMIRILAQKGGVIGVNFAPEFLNKDLSKKDSTASMISLHLRHMINIGGIECAAIGSDFDGISGDLEIAGAEKMPMLFDQLKRDGLKESQIEKIAWRNALRVISDVL
jgi:membrane dipeptidase